MQVFDIKPAPTTPWEEHKQWLNRRRAELIQHMGKRIIVKGE